MTKGKGRSRRSAGGQGTAAHAAVEHQPQTESTPRKPSQRGSESRTQNAPVVATETISEAFSGPIPHPALLAEYDQIVPNGAERIMQMAESQVADRQEMERTYVRSQTTTERRGQVMAFALAALALVLGAALVFTDHSGYGFSLIITSIAALAGINVFSRILEHKEAAERRREELDAGA